MFSVSDSGLCQMSAILSNMCHQLDPAILHLLSNVQEGVKHPAIRPSSAVRPSESRINLKMDRCM